MIRHAHRVFKDHFIPHPGNDHAPHALRHRALFGYSVSLIALKVLVFTVAVFVPSALVFSSAVTAANILALTNETRAGMGLPELQANEQLTVAAQSKASDMIADQYFAHNAPDGTTPWDWIRATGYTYTLAGENLAVYFKTAEEVTAGWMASPTHRANIVNDRFTEIGIGVVEGEYQGYQTSMVVQMFGEPIPLTNDVPAEPTEIPEPQWQEEPAPPVEEPLGEQPIEEPTPEPTEGPTELPEPAPTEIVVVPVAEGYRVEATVPEAQAVEVKAGVNMVALALVEGEEDQWEGTLPPVETDARGEVMYLETTDQDGEETVQPIMTLTAAKEVGEVYAFGAKPPARVQLLFGLIDVHGLEDGVRQIYFLTIVLLGGALLVSMIANFERHRHSVTAHALIVMVLAAMLAVV